MIDKYDKYCLNNFQGDRERDFELVKRRIEDEKEELQQTINRFPLFLLMVMMIIIILMMNMMVMEDQEKEELQQTINVFLLLLCFCLEIKVHKRIAIILIGSLYR